MVTVGGALCAAFIAGLTGVVLGVALITIGLGGIVLLVFLEIGLGEDHAREREQWQRRTPPQASHPPRAAWPAWSRRRPRRPG